MWLIYKLWKTNEHTILKLWTLIKNIVERTHKFPYNILFTFLMDRGRAPNGIGHLMILLLVYYLEKKVELTQAIKWVMWPDLLHRHTSMLAKVSRNDRLLLHDPTYLIPIRRWSHIRSCLRSSDLSSTWWTISSKMDELKVTLYHIY